MGKVIDRRKQAMGGHSKRPINKIKNIAVHYSATKEGNTAAFERFWKGTHGWSTGGYHEVVLTNGDVELNYDANTISNGVGGQNTRMYNICYVGDGKPNAKQLKVLKERVNYNCKRLGVSVGNVKGHREFAGQSTNCPALNMSEFRKTLNSGVSSTGGGNTSKPSKKPQKPPKTNGKSISQMVQEVIDGKHGNGHAQRRKSLGISSNEYKKVRDRVNAVASGEQDKPTTIKTVQQMANEVKKGLHGNGHANRRKSLGISKSEYEKVRKLVNTGIHPSSSKTVSQMAKEVIDGKHGQGHANRRKSLGISQAQYNKVRAEVNKRLK